jgi:hypothetical protein
MLEGGNEKVGGGGQRKRRLLMYVYWPCIWGYEKTWHGMAWYGMGLFSIHKYHGPLVLFQGYEATYTDR